MLDINQGNNSQKRVGIVLLTSYDIKWNNINDKSRSDGIIYVSII